MSQKTTKTNKIAMLTISFALISPAIWFLATLAYTTVTKEYKKPLQRKCEGTVETMFFSAPLRIDLKNDRLKWRVDIRKVARLGKDFVDLPEIISGTNDIGVQSSKGILAEWVNTNMISIKAWHTNGALILDRCTLELPVTVDSAKSLITLAEKAESFIKIVPNLGL